jgi:hypothetical protein
MLQSSIKTIVKKNIQNIINSKGFIEFKKLPNLLKDVPINEYKVKTSIIVIIDSLLDGIKNANGAVSDKYYYKYLKYKEKYLELKALKNLKY